MEPVRYTKFRTLPYAGTVVTRILNWAWKDAGKLRVHYCGDFRKVYEVDRSEIVWTTDQRHAVCKVAPDWVRRILIADCETGLRPADLVRLHRNQIEATPMSRRICIRTNKRKRLATIPVTADMARLIEATPADRMLILVSDAGNPMTRRHASDSLRYWRNQAGLAPDAFGLRPPPSGHGRNGCHTASECRSGAGSYRCSHGLVGALRGCGDRTLRPRFTRRTDAILVKLSLAKGGKE